VCRWTVWPCRHHCTVENRNEFMPWGTLLQKVTVAHQSQTAVLYGILTIITVFTVSCHWNLYWATLIQSKHSLKLYVTTSSKRSTPFNSSDWTSVYIYLPSACYISPQSYHPWFYDSYNVSQLSIFSVYSLLCSSVATSRLRPNVFRGILFLNTPTLRLHVSLGTSDRSPYPYSLSEYRSRCT
jgi:hypothetical protein